MKIFNKLTLKYFILYISIMLFASIATVVVARVINLAQYFPEEYEEILREFFPRIANVMGFIFFIIGTIFVVVATNIIVKPVKELSHCSKEVSNGNFNVKAKTYTKNDELELLINNFNLMVEKLSKNEYLHKNFVSNLSHEYKTPLTAIQGYAEMLKSCELNTEQVQEYANNILVQSLRLSTLSRDLLKISEIDINSSNIKKTEYNLGIQIRDIIILYQTKWEEKNIEFDVDIDDVIYIGEKQLMYHVFSNLIDNAIKYSNNDGMIIVKLKQDNDIKFTIEDNGIGIEKEKLSKIFDRFYQSEVEQNINGSGLGLSIVSKIVEIHDGKIDVVSDKNKGTKFIITL